MTRVCYHLQRSVVGLLLATLVSGITTHPLIAATFFVDVSSGDDTRDAAASQSEDTPWKSLNRALGEDTLAAGDVISVGPGIYDADAGTTYPLNLVNGVAIVGSDAGQTILLPTLGNPAFTNQGSLPDGAWLSDLRLGRTGTDPGPGIDLDLDDAKLALIIDSVTFDRTLEDGIRAGLESGSGELDLTITNSTFNNTLHGIDINATSATSIFVTATLDNDTFSNGYSGFNMYSSSMSGVASVDITATDNRFNGDPGRGLYHYSSENRSQVAMKLTLSNNSFTNDSDGVYAYFTSGQSASIDINAQDNSFHNSDYGIYAYIQNASGSANTAMSLSNNSFSGNFTGVALSSNQVNASGTMDLDIVDNSFDNTAREAVFLYQYETGGPSKLDFLASGNTFTDIGGNGISISVSSLSTASATFDTVIENNEFARVDGRAVDLDMRYMEYGTVSVSHTISGNSIYSAAGNAIEISLTSMSSADGTIAIDVSDNVITGVDDAGIYLTNEYLYNPSLQETVTIHGNTIASASYSGIQLHNYSWNSGLLSQNVSIRNNTITGAGGKGISISASSFDQTNIALRYDIMNNQIAYPDSEGIYFYLYDAEDSDLTLDLTLRGNTITDAGSAGLSISLSSVYYDSTKTDVAVLGNEVSGSGSYEPGIYYAQWYFEEGNLDSRLTIAGNTVSGASGEGIDVYLSELSSNSDGFNLDVSIYNNTISNPGDDGIIFSASYLDYNPSGTASFTIAGNTITGANGDGIMVEISSWYDSEVDQTVLVAGNTITGSSDDGLSLSLSDQTSLTTNDVRIMDNVADGNNGSGLYLESNDLSSPNLRVSGNTIVNNGGDGIFLYDSYEDFPAADLGGGQLDSPGLNRLTGNAGYQLYYEYGASDNPDLFAQMNYWGTTDLDEIEELVYDDEESNHNGAVDFTDPLDAAPETAAIASLTVEVLDDVGLAGFSPGDTVRYTAAVTGIGDIGCATTTFSVSFPDEVDYVEGSATSSKGMVGWADADGLLAWIQWIAAGETISVSWDMKAALGSSCGEIAIQGVFECYQLGTMLTNDPSTADDADPTVSMMATATYYEDKDGDGSGDPESPLTLCVIPPEGYVTNSDDCDDDEAAINLDAIEVCDEVDNNCDGQIDEAIQTAFFADQDEDGYGDAGNTIGACSLPDGYVEDHTDCYDYRDDVYPGAPEICDGVDNDCDDEIDEDGDTTFYADADADGYGTTEDTIVSCEVASSYTSQVGDCDDTRDAVYPGADEICDTHDNDCDGEVDEDGESYFYPDDDGDGFGGTGDVISACGTVAGYASNADDCDDTSGDINPDATEVCDGQDNDCDSDTDEGVMITFYADDDGDEYGDALAFQLACHAPSGYVTDAGDCDDTDVAINPDAEELCDGLDNNCNSSTDEGLTQVFFVDEDSDGYGSPSETLVACQAEEGYVGGSDDCNDDAPDIHPGADELCDDIDNNCDGYVDEADDCQVDITPAITPAETPEGDVGGGGCNGCNSGDRGTTDPWLAFAFAGLLLRRRRSRSRNQSRHP